MDRPACTGIFFRLILARFILYYSCYAKELWKLSLFRLDLLARLVGRGHLQTEDFLGNLLIFTLDAFQLCFSRVEVQ